MTPNYVLIDYENVQPETADILAPAHFKVLLFVGANQPRVNVDVASALQAKGADARYIRSSGAGRNALDFHIVYYLGQLAAAEPEAFFHVISADKGMDPLIEHMKAKGLNVYRHADVKHIPIVKLAPTAPDDEKLSCILAYLTARGSQRPASIKTLTGSSRALFSPKLTEDATARLLRLLEAEGIFTRNGNRIVYSLPV